MVGVVTGMAPTGGGRVGVVMGEARRTGIAPGGGDLCRRGGGVGMGVDVVGGVATPTRGECPCEFLGDALLWWFIEVVDVLYSFGNHEIITFVLILGHKNVLLIYH